MYILYGIPNCDSVKKARTWLDQHEISYRFHNYREAGITQARLNAWCKQLGWEQLLNKSSTTWKGLDAGTHQAVTSQAAAVGLMAVHHTLIKRPVIELEDKVVAIRFKEEEYQRVFL